MRRGNRYMWYNWLPKVLITVLGENTAYIYLLSAAEEGGMCTEVRKALNLAVDRDEIVQCRNGCLDINRQTL